MPNYSSFPGMPHHSMVHSVSTVTSSRSQSGKCELLHQNCINNRTTYHLYPKNVSSHRAFSGPIISVIIVTLHQACYVTRDNLNPNFFFKKLQNYNTNAILENSSTIIYETGDTWSHYFKNQYQTFQQ